LELVHLSNENYYHWNGLIPGLGGPSPPARRRRIAPLLRGFNPANPRGVEPTLCADGPAFRRLNDMWHQIPPIRALLHGYCAGTAI